MRTQASDNVLFAATFKMDPDKTYYLLAVVTAGEAKIKQIDDALGLLYNAKWTWSTSKVKK